MTSAQAPIIYLVDDDEAFRESLRWMLRVAGFRVEVYATAEHFLNAHQRGAGSCLILDLRMPGMSGLELQDELMRRREYVPIIFVTAHGDVSLAVRAVKRGALDFIEKPFNGEALVKLVRKALRYGAPALAMAANRALTDDRLDTLSPREHEVMLCVIDGKTNKTIAAELGISIKTVECHRSRMMEKLGANSVVELVRLVANSSAPLGSEYQRYR